MNNRIAWKLTAYFAVVLIFFAMAVGIAFTHLFKQHTIDIKKKEMQVRAVRIAEVISDNMNFIQKRTGGSIAGSRFISYLDNVTMEDVWVVDAQRNLNMPAAASHHLQVKQQGRKHHRMQLENNPRAAYDALSDAAKSHIDEVFQGKTFTIEEFNPVLEDIVVTVGVPVYDQDGQVRAAVLLNSSVQGMREAAWEGIRLLLISGIIAMLMVIVLSIMFSWHFTRPLNIMKDIASRLADRDYTARCNIVRDDEIGALAKTLDELSGRLQKADEESQKLEKLRREFIANISHELRTPVTVIRGSLEALQDGVVTDAEEIKYYYEQMHRESIFLQRLINDLLDLSRLQNVDFPIEKELLNLCDVVQDVLRSGRQLGAEKKLQITADMDTDVYVVNGDYGRLRQMLMIFVQNSIKFSAEGGSIEIALHGNKLTVTDHGCGIKQEDLLHAFDRFYKARNERNKSGSGLGLAIAKQIALRHNMQLALDSKEQVYTQVTVTLPPKEKV